MKTFITLLIFVFTFQCISISGQPENIKSDSLNTIVPKRNVVKWNLTPMLLWNVKNINLSYERVTSPHGSFSLNAGIFLLPSSGSYDSINIKKTNKNRGFSISGDKRWYLKKRNTKYAPDGIYLGVFGSFHTYAFENSFEIKNSSVAQGNLDLNGNIGIASLGVELGYQFVFKNNITVDLIFIGPALSAYWGSLSIGGDLKVDDDSEYVKAIYDVLSSKFPGIDKLINDKTVKDNGSVFTMGPGLRYMIQVGYRF